MKEIQMHSVKLRLLIQLHATRAQWVCSEAENNATEKWLLCLSRKQNKTEGSNEQKTNKVKPNLCDWLSTVQEENEKRITVKIRSGVWGPSNVRCAFVKLSFLLEIMLWCLLQVETVLCRPAAVWLLQDVFCRDGVVICGVWFGWLAGCLVQRWWCDVWLACMMYFAEMVVWCLIGSRDVFCRGGGVTSPCVMFGWFAGCILQRWHCDVWCLVGLQDVFYRDGIVMFGWFAGCLLLRWCCDVWCLVGFQDVFCGDGAGIGVPAQLRHCASRPQTWQVSRCLSLSLTVSPLSLLSPLTPFTATHLTHKSWSTS